jgi:hypothetical protein
MRYLLIEINYFKYSLSTKRLNITSAIFQLEEYWMVAKAIAFTNAEESDGGKSVPVQWSCQILESAPQC